MFLLNWKHIRMQMLCILTIFRLLAYAKTVQNTFTAFSTDFPFCNKKHKNGEKMTKMVGSVYLAAGWHPKDGWVPTKKFKFWQNICHCGTQWRDPLMTLRGKNLCSLQWFYSGHSGFYPLVPLSGKGTSPLWTKKDNIIQS